MIGTVRTVILKPRTTIVNLGWTTFAIASSFLSRVALDDGRLGSVFAFVYPAVLFTAVLLGWRWGALTAVVGELLAVRFFRRPGITTTEYLEELPILLVASISMTLIILTAELLRRALQQSESLRQRSEMRSDELVHRNKNSFQLIQALAWHGKQFSDPASFYDTLTGRIAAMGRANELLQFGVTEQCEASEVVASCASAFDHSRIHGAGPANCWVGRDAVVPLSMCLHELCTNATKYGALSVPEGWVDVDWSVKVSGRNRIIVLHWQERGGPKVVAPKTEGMGLLLLRPHGDIQSVDVDFSQEGLRCTIEVKAGTGAVG